MSCWNGLCIAGDCDGEDHVDVTGCTWRERHGQVYCVDHDLYDFCHVMPPPVDPDDPAVRLLRAVYGVCPDCDHPAESHHDGDDYGSTHHCRECEPAE